MNLCERCQAQKKEKHTIKELLGSFVGRAMLFATGQQKGTSHSSSESNLADGKHRPHQT